MPPPGLLTLIERFERNLDDYRAGRYKEARLRREFVDPFFKLLGWDVENTAGLAEAYKDVVHEDAIKVGGGNRRLPHSRRVAGCTSRPFPTELEGMQRLVRGDRLMKGIALAVLATGLLFAAEAAEKPQPTPQSEPHAPAEGSEIEGSPKRIPPPKRPADASRAVVKRVVNGSTLILRDGRQVRLVGVECPNPFSKDPKDKKAAYEAIAFVENAVLDGAVYLEFDQQVADKYGRLFAYVWRHYRMLNAELVRRGLAKVVESPPNVKHHEYLLVVQDEASGEKIGFWAKEEARKPLSYKIIERKDVSFLRVVRLSFKITVDGRGTKAALGDICRAIIKKEGASRPFNAISFFFYLPGTDTRGHYTAGRADWAPFGDWAQADAVKTGDYSKHRLVVEVSNALGEAPESSIIRSIPQSKRKQVFWALVKAQDDGVGDEKAYHVIAKRYKLDVDTVRKIAVEGAIKGWPTP